MGILNADGAFAEHVAVPIANLHAVPTASPTTRPPSASRSPRRSRFSSRCRPRASRCVVLGDGKLGLLAAQVLAAAAPHAGGRRHERKLAVLRGRGIEAVTLDAWDRTRADVVVEATAPRRVRSGGGGDASARHGGAEEHGAHAAPPSGAGGDRRAHGLGCCGPFAPALDALARGTVDVTSLISAGAAARWRRGAAPGGGAGRREGSARALSRAARRRPMKLPR
jgi:threonine dehydrogenase-like Zn-dependent dehydrogenase